MKLLDKLYVNGQYVDTVNENPVPLGTPGQVLTVQEDGTGVEWKTPAGGGATLYTHFIQFTFQNYDADSDEYYDSDANLIITSPISTKVSADCTTTDLDKFCLTILSGTVICYDIGNGPIVLMSRNSRRGFNIIALDVSALDSAEVSKLIPAYADESDLKGYIPFEFSKITSYTVEAL